MIDRRRIDSYNTSFNVDYLSPAQQPQTQARPWVQGENGDKEGPFSSQPSSREGEKETGSLNRWGESPRSLNPQILQKSSRKEQPAQLLISRFSPFNAPSAILMVHGAGLSSAGDSAMQCNGIDKNESTECCCRSSYIQKHSVKIFLSFQENYQLLRHFKKLGVHSSCY